MRNKEYSEYLKIFTSLIMPTMGDKSNAIKYIKYISEEGFPYLQKGMLDSDELTIKNN